MSANPRPAYDLRPLAMGEMLDYSFRLYQKVFPYIAVPYAVIQGPFLLPLNVFQAASSHVDLGSIFGGGTPKDLTEVLNETFGIDPAFLAGISIWTWIMVGIGVVLVTILYIIAGAIVQIGVVSVVSDRVLGREPSRASVIEAYKRFGMRALGTGLAKFGIGVGIMLLPMAVFFAGLMMLAASPVLGGILSVIGGFLMFAGYVVLIYAIQALSLTEPALVTEDLDVIPAIRRSFELIKGHWWRTFGVMFVLQFLIGIVSGFVQTFMTLGLLMVPTQFAVIADAVSRTAIQIFITPIGLVLWVLLYFDIRVRKEQFDLLILMGGSAAAAPVPAGGYGGGYGGAYGSPTGPTAAPAGYDYTQAPPTAYQPSGYGTEVFPQPSYPYQPRPDDPNSPSPYAPPPPSDPPPPPVR